MSIKVLDGKIVNTDDLDKDLERISKLGDKVSEGQIFWAETYTGDSMHPNPVTLKDVRDWKKNNTSGFTLWGANDPVNSEEKEFDNTKIKEFLDELLDLYNYEDHEDLLEEIISRIEDFRDELSEESEEDDETEEEWPTEEWSEIHDEDYRSQGGWNARNDYKIFREDFTDWQLNWKLQVDHNPITTVTAY